MNTKGQVTPLRNKGRVIKLSCEFFCVELIIKTLLMAIILEPPQNVYFKQYFDTKKDILQQQRTKNFVSFFYGNKIDLVVYL